MSFSGNSQTTPDNMVNSYKVLFLLEDGCTDIGEVSNGVRFGDSIAVGSKVNFECKKGYRLIGSPTLTCRRGGRWDRNKPVCQMSGKLNS